MKPLLLPLISCISLIALANACGGEKKIAWLDDTRLRIVSYNVFFTSIFPQDDGKPNVGTPKKFQYNREDRLRRFAEWAPRAHADIWVLQEVINGKEQMESQATTVEGIIAYFSQLTSQKWYGIGDNQGQLILSKFPITWNQNGVAKGHAALVELPEEISPTNLLIVNQHFPWGNAEGQVKCANTASDFISQLIKEKTPIGDRDYRIMVCGDFNCETDAEAYRIIMDISADATSKLLYNPFPKQLNSEHDGTLGSVNWSGEPGASKPNLDKMKAIDFVLPSKDFMTLNQCFVLNSLILPRETLLEYGIDRQAVLFNTRNDGAAEGVDHLPLFIDFK